MLVTYFFGIGKRVTILLPIFFYHNTAQSLPRLGLGRVVTPQNFHKLFLGQKPQKKLIWGLHNSIAGFIDARDARLPAIAAGAEPEVQALPESVTNRKRIETIRTQLNQL